MSNLFRVSLWLCCGIFASVFCCAQGKPALKTKRNQDRSLFKIVESESRRSNTRRIEVFFAPNGASKPRRLLQLSQNLDEAPTGGADFTDLDGDGFYEIEVRGMCGAGPNCEGDLYRLDRASKSLYHFFSGGYAELLYLDGYLIESGRASCCAWELHAYKVAKHRRLIADKNMSLLIEVKAEGDAAGNVTSVECKFNRVTGAVLETINPPSAKWLKLCEQFGTAYQVAKPEPPKR